MQKLVFASQYIDAAQNSTGYYFSGLIDGMKPDFGQIEIISNTPLFGNLKKRNEYFSEKSFKNGFLSRLFEQVILSFRFGWGVLHRVKSCDVLVTGTNPVFLLPLVAVLKFFKKFRWCLIVHDVFPENLVPAGILCKGSIAYRLIDVVFSNIYKLADKVIVIGRDMENVFVDKIGPSKSITYIPNWACDRDVFPISRSSAPFVSELGWQNKIVVQFFGNIGRLQGIDNILNSIALTMNKELAFLFIGSGAKVDTIRRFIENHPDKSVAYVGPLPLDAKNLGLAACDIAFVTLEAGMSGLGVPSKSYFSMAADKPILAVMDQSAEISMVVEEYGIGWCCKPDDPIKLAAILDNISKDSVFEMVGKPRAVLMQHFSRGQALDVYKKCLLELFDGNLSS